MRRFFCGVVVFGLVVVSGCGTLRMNRLLLQSGDQWNQFGGNPMRQFSTMEDIDTPLSLRWTYDASAGFGPASVVAIDSFLVFGTLKGELYLLNLYSGNPAGHVALGSAIAAAPVVLDSVVYITITNDERGVVAYDLRRGGVAWKAQTGASETSPLVIGSRLFVTTLDGTLICLDRVSGSIIWTYSVPDRHTRSFIRSSPAYADSLLLFGCDDGRLYAVHARDGSLRWKKKTGASIVATPSVRESSVYVGSSDGYMYAVHLHDGSLIWTVDVGAPMFNAAAVDDSSIYVGTTGRRVVSLNRFDGTLRWSFSTGSAVNSAPLVTPTRVYVGSLDRRLYALDRSTGTLLWQREFESRIKTSPVIYRGYLVVQLENQEVVALTKERQ